MRLRKIKEAETILQEDGLYLVKNPQTYYSKWSEVFGNNNPIHIEIGMGKGKFILELARQNPEINFIGIEKYDSVLYKAIVKAQQEQFLNLRFLWVDAEKLPQIFGPNEIDRLYLNFSDPWPKTKQKKRRLTYPTMLKKYRMFLKQNAQIQFKTDNFGLFTDSMMYFVDQSFEVQSITLDLHQVGDPTNIETEFETKFKAAGHPIYRIICQ